MKQVKLCASAHVCLVVTLLAEMKYIVRSSKRVRVQHVYSIAHTIVRARLQTGEQRAMQVLCASFGPAVDERLARARHAYRGAATGRGPVVDKGLVGTGAGGSGDHHLIRANCRNA